LHGKRENLLKSLLLKREGKLKRKLSEASHAEEPAQPEQELQEDVAE